MLRVPAGGEYKDAFAAARGRKRVIERKLLKPGAGSCAVQCSDVAKNFLLCLRSFVATKHPRIQSGQLRIELITERYLS